MLKTILEKLAEVTNMDPLEVAIWFIILGIFVWLCKEFKAHHQKNKEIWNAKNDQFMVNISKSLSLAYQSKSDPAKDQEFFNSVFDCFPLWSSYEIEEVKVIIEDDSISDHEKIEKIKDKLYQQLINFSDENKKLKEIKSGLEAVDYALNKLKDLVLPIVQALFTLAGVVISYVIISIGDNITLSSIRLFSLLLLILLPIAYIDFFQKKKLKSNSILFIILSFTSLIFIVLQNNSYFIIMGGAIFLSSLLCLFKMGLKVSL
ncbi:hypothetical protein SAMN04487944_1025 [Gracilibacillus ureilyticus]|uniref:Uncharacterized protein n=1 Tax=Gracilibacillus ureilyticus TaxID=531814 RepID=A0A1H9MJ90_9BACI|nr:hypothetical protein [Gracilibacillus ureilyticus]SER23527.1 hypothetical protein SAMN04487944_1025 [Gracilibacillus ureilyticus]